MNRGELFHQTGGSGRTGQSSLTPLSAPQQTDHRACAVRYRTEVARSAFDCYEHSPWTAARLAHISIEQMLDSARRHEDSPTITSIVQGRNRQVRASRRSFIYRDPDSGKSVKVVCLRQWENVDAEPHHHKLLPVLSSADIVETCPPTP